MSNDTTDTPHDAAAAEGLSESELAEIEARANAATDGPWRDFARAYFDACKQDKKQTGHWYHGSERDSCPVALIAQDLHYGEPIDPERDFPRRVDWWDLRQVIGWRWSMLPKRTTDVAEGFFAPEDAAFIAAARTDVPKLITEVRRLRRALQGEAGG